eukprot:789126_1
MDDDAELQVKTHKIDKAEETSNASEETETSDEENRTNKLSFSIQSTYDKTDSDKYDADKPPTKQLDLTPKEVSHNMEFMSYGISNVLGTFFSSQVRYASFSLSAEN